MNTKKCGYQIQSAEMTLREGIDEYHKVNPHLLLPNGLDLEATEFFQNHDHIHVVFGCNTSIAHEFRADFWTMFGSDISILKYVSYLKSSAVKALIKDIKKRKASDEVRVTLKEVIPSALTALPLVFLRTRKMKKKWPWTQYGRYLDKPLKDND